jgi:hypothetical protein
VFTVEQRESVRRRVIDLARGVHEFPDDVQASFEETLVRELAEQLEPYLREIQA